MTRLKKMLFSNVNPFPTPEQELLLKASLFSENEAIKAWELWNKKVDFEGYFDNGSFRLLPLVYKNLLQTGREILFMGKLKNVYLQSWYKNQKLFYSCANQVQSLSENSINNLILKGIPLSLEVYQDHGVRPMADFDIMVPLSQVEGAISILERQGWIIEKKEYLEYNLLYGKSISFKQEGEPDLDLHWLPFFEAHKINTLTEFWDRAEPLRIFGISTLRLCFADMLLHVILHGLHYNPEPPIRWVPDSVKLIQNCNEKIDWDCFLREMRKYEASYKVKIAFNYLSNTFGTVIPGEVIRQINSVKIHHAERMLFKYSALIEEESEAGFFKKIFQLYLIYLRQAEKCGFLKRLLGFLQFLRFRTRNKDLLKILFYYLFYHKKFSNH